MKKLMIVFITLLSITAFGQDSTKQELTKEVIYKDVKNVLSQLGSTLKVGSEHVYMVLVRQQVVNSFTWLSVYIVFIIVSLTLIKIGIKFYSKDYERQDTYALFLISGSGFALCGLICFFATISRVITGFVNPEYGAIKTIIDLL